MAVLMRTLGVPSRAVTGFFGGTYNRFGRYYAVRQGDAHSWVEVYVPERGWQRFDPTPPASAAPQSEITGVLAFVRDFAEAAAQRYSKHVVSYDLHQQLRLIGDARSLYGKLRLRSSLPEGLNSPRRLGLVLCGVALIGIGLWWLLRRRSSATLDGDRAQASDPPHRREVVRLYGQLEAALAARGIPRHPGTPPLGHAQALVEIGHPSGPIALELTRLYLDVRFGGRELGDADRKKFTQLVRELRRPPKESPRLRSIAA
jgi:hypothetical protein